MMSIVRCDLCNASVDSDQHEMQAFRVDQDETVQACPKCCEEIEANTKAFVTEYRAVVSERVDLINAGRGHLLPETWEP